MNSTGLVKSGAWNSCCKDPGENPHKWLWSVAAVPKPPNPRQGTTKTDLTRRMLRFLLLIFCAFIIRADGNRARVTVEAPGNERRNVALLEGAGLKNPKDAFEMSMKLQQHQRFEEAIAILDAAWEEWPKKRGPVHDAILGSIYSAMDRRYEAASALDRAVSFAPHVPFYAVSAGISHYNLGRLEGHWARNSADAVHQLRKAIELYDRAIALEPNDAFSWHKKGKALNLLVGHSGKRNDTITTTKATLADTEEPRATSRAWWREGAARGFFKSEWQYDGMYGLNYGKVGIMDRPRTSIDTKSKRHHQPFWSKEDLLSKAGAQQQSTESCDHDTCDHDHPVESGGIGISLLIRKLESQWENLRDEALDLLEEAILSEELDIYEDADEVATSDSKNEADLQGGEKGSMSMEGGGGWYQFYLQKEGGQRHSETLPPDGDKQPCWSGAPVVCALLEPFLHYAEANSHTTGSSRATGRPRDPDATENQHAKTMLPLLRGRQKNPLNPALPPEPFHAFYSIVTGATQLTPHCGPTESTLRLHLPLRIPQGDYRLTVRGETRKWEEGRLLAFDESYEHEVWADPGSIEGERGLEATARVLLVVDILHPDKWE